MLILNAFHFSYCCYIILFVLQLMIIWFHVWNLDTSLLTLSFLFFFLVGAVFCEGFKMFRGLFLLVLFLVQSLNFSPANLQGLRMSNRLQHSQFVSPDSLFSIFTVFFYPFRQTTLDSIQITARVSPQSQSNIMSFPQFLGSHVVYYPPCVKCLSNWLSRSSLFFLPSCIR